jgi:hypothetical protein
MPSSHGNYQPSISILKIPVGENGAIQIDANYRHSLNDMFLDNITDIRIKSHGLSAGLGYTMRF